MNEVALHANDVLRNDVMLRINDVALRANGFCPTDCIPTQKCDIIYLTQASKDRKAVRVIKSAIKKFFSFILAILIAIIFGVCLIFILPFDYIKYKRSLYYKITKKKYTFFAASNQNFKIYNEINKHNLPIRFLHHPKEESIVYGWFVFEKTLIIVNAFNFEYDSESEKWIFSGEYDEEENRVLLSIDEYIKTEIEEVNQALGDKVCDKAVILICGDDLENAENAYKEERFLIYKGDMIEKLKLFVKAEK